MAYYKITTNKKGELVAKMQVYGKDLSTGERKLYVKRVYNENGLTEAKFKKFLDKEAIAFEEEVARAYREHDVSVKARVLTFHELMAEWKETIKTNLSISYYERACEVEKKFNEYLKEVRLYDKPISSITVRDVQLFLNSFASKKYNLTLKLTAKLKNPLPKKVNFRQLAREGIIDRNRSYYMNHNDTHITKETAQAICERYNLNYDDYFETVKNERSYAVETIKGYRRVLRTLFNEAVRYEWIAKNPVCGTKIGAGSSNTSLRAVPEKEVFSFKEAQEFLSMLDGLSDDIINQRVCIKLMLLTGIRNAELHGLRWSDVDLENHILHVRRNRLVSPQFGVYEKSPKTKTSLRDIPMPDNLVEDLKRYKDWFRLADDNFDEKQDEYYLAVGLDRRPLYPHTMGHWLTKLETKHGFKRVSCHGLRHTYCSLLLSQNVPIQTVSKYMGHSDSTVTLEVYSHFIPDTQEKAVFALNNLTK